uniref:Uncharacterized protein n=1 Tax=Callorhinchus milii TaxID=7868 RepID=A0A4W3GRL2_CALMI
MCLGVLQKFERKYNAEVKQGKVSKASEFEYAWCLIRSRYPDDIKRGIVILEGERVRPAQDRHCVYVCESDRHHVQERERARNKHRLSERLHLLLGRRQLQVKGQKLSSSMCERVFICACVSPCV